MPEPQHRPRLHFKFVALSLIGTALVLVPLTEVLQVQGQALQAAKAERALLDPMANAVALQRALLAHRDLAAQVLRGRSSWEPQRKLRADEVDHQVNTLSQTLGQLALQGPLEESQALAEDWWQLARAVGAGRISPSASDLPHRLRVEQSLQVMDMLTASWAPAGNWGSATLRQATLSLPRLTLQWAMVGPDGEEGLGGVAQGTSAADTETAQAALAQQARLLARLATTAATAQGVSPDAALASQARAAQQATGQLLALWHGAAPASAVQQDDPGPALLAARDAALQAVQALQGSIWQHYRADVLAREAQQEQRRALTWAGLGALLLAGLWLLQGLRRAAPQPLRAAPGLPQQAAAAAEAAPVAKGAESGPEAGRLLQRLRDAEDPAAAPCTQAPARQDATLPPPA